MPSPALYLHDPNVGIRWACDRCNAIFDTKEDANKCEIFHRFENWELPLLE